MFRLVLVLHLCTSFLFSQVIALPYTSTLVSFDDGYACVKEYALALAPNSAIAIAPGILNKGIKKLTWNDIRELDRAGVQVWSHSLTHRDLRTLSDKDLLYELTESKRIIEKELGHKITTIAYPYGAVDARVIKFAIQAGYTQGFATDYSFPSGPMNQFRSSLNAAISRRKHIFS